MKTKVCVGYSVSQSRKPGLSHCYEGIFDLFVQPAGNCTRNHGTIIIAFKTCVPSGTLASFLQAWSCFWTHSRVT